MLQWAWVKDLEKHKYSDFIRYFKIDELNEGVYEVRFFLNNSYDTFNSLQFSIQQKGAPLHLFRQNQKNSIEFIVNRGFLADKSWIGFFKKDKESNRNKII